MFALYDESINVDRFIEFLQKVIDSSNKKGNPQTNNTNQK
jgi:hypothetical protein